MGSCAFKPTCNESNETNKEKESLINQPFRIITPDDVAEMKQEVSRKKIAKAPVINIKINPLYLKRALTIKKIVV